MFLFFLLTIHFLQGGFSAVVKSLRVQCIELLTEIEARLDFDDEMPPLDTEKLISKIDTMWQNVQLALETASYDRLLQSGIQVNHDFVPNKLETLYFYEHDLLDDIIFFKHFLSFLIPYQLTIRKSRFVVVMYR